MDEASALEEMAAGLEHSAIARLRALGAQLSEDAFASDATRLADASVIAYSLAKFLEKHYIAESTQWRNFAHFTVQKLLLAASLLKEGKALEAEKTLDSVLEDVEALSESSGRFHTGVVTKARLKLAADAYAHGASLGRAAAFARVDKKLVLSYIGATRLGDKFETMAVTERLAAARKVFA